ISRYHDITELLKDSRLSSGVYNAMVEQSPEQLKPYLEFLMNGIGFMDPPNHTRLRNLVHYGFAPNFISDLEERIQRITDQAIDDLLTQGDAVVNLKTDFAITVPFKVLTEFLNLPYEDRDLFRRWTEGLLGGIATNAGYEDLLTGVRTVNELRTYFVDLIEYRRKNLSNDFITLLIAAEEQGDRLNNEEMIYVACGRRTRNHQ
ncbi:MAG: cytochrome P450, partial [Anaerolineae bacterium]|nr:cytochrome P450 [Anaerolineae bacterium]